MSTEIIFKALAFASEKHKDQKRKGGSESPYINHPIKVAKILVENNEENNATLLAAAILHDTIEDTNTNKEELEDLFGFEVCKIVCECTDDKTLKKHERKQFQIDSAAGASNQAKKLKIADKICNMMDIKDDPPKNWSTNRRLDYLDWCEKVFEAGLRGVNEKLEANFIQELNNSRQKLNDV